MSLQNLYPSAGLGGSDSSPYDAIVANTGGDYTKLSTACATEAVGAKIWVKDDIVETTDVNVKEGQKIHSCGRTIDFSNNTNTLIAGSTLSPLSYVEIIGLSLINSTADALQIAAVNSKIILHKVNNNKVGVRFGNTSSGIVNSFRKLYFVNNNQSGVISSGDSTIARVHNCNNNQSTGMNTQSNTIASNVNANNTGVQAPTKLKVGNLNYNYRSIFTSLGYSLIGNIIKAYIGINSSTETTFIFCGNISDVEYQVFESNVASTNEHIQNIFELGQIYNSSYLSYNASSSSLFKIGSINNTSIGISSRYITIYIGNPPCRIKRET